jgi:phage shock protein E
VSWIGALLVVAVVYIVANLVVRRFGLFSSALDHEALRELVERQDGSYSLIDVRSPTEYAQGHIPTAVNIPHDTIAANPPKQPKDSLVVLYCQTGSRSTIARSILTRQGFTDVINFGSLRRWKSGVVTGMQPGTTSQEGQQDR